MSVYREGAAELLGRINDDSVALIWTDPPFGTGKRQELESTWGQYGRLGYMDRGQTQTIDLCIQTANEAARILRPDGVLALLLDYRCIHEAIVAIRSETSLFFAGEIVWHFELGGVSKSWWTNKHNTIALFRKASPQFHLDRVPTVERRAKRGDYTSDMRRANSVWNHTMGPLAKERTGYPNQKPLAIVEPFVNVHTDPGDLVVDPFCGSGTVAVAAFKNDRRFIVGDTSPDAVAITRDRLIDYGWSDD